MAAARAIGEGRVINHTAGGTVSAGDVLEMAAGIGVYLEDAVSGQVVAVAIEGEFELDKETGAAHNLGDRLYWDASNDRVDKTDTNIPCGICTLAAASGAARVRVKINAGAPGESSG